MRTNCTNMFRWSLIIFCIVIVPSVLAFLYGAYTRQMISNYTYRDPLPACITRAYWLSDRVLIEYTVPTNDPQWTKSNVRYREYPFRLMGCQDLQDLSVFPMHYSAIPENVISSVKEMEKTDCNPIRRIPWDYAQEESTPVLPHIYYNLGFFDVVVRNRQADGSIVGYEITMTGHEFIPLRNYGKIAISAPLNIIKDIVTSPLQLFGYLMWKDVH